MAITPVDASLIKSACRVFDENLRGTPEFSGWQHSKAQRYALGFEGRNYPPKKIISLATGTPVSSFSGGRESNEYLTALGYKIVPLAASKLIAQFTVGKDYDRKTEIHDPFGGSGQSGIAPSNVAEAIFLFTGESGCQYGYEDTDGFDQNGFAVFSYTGEGQVGDMEFTRGNRAVREHSNDGRALHLFRSLGKGKKNKYLGEFVYAGHMDARGPDRNGVERNLIVFQLVSVETAFVLESTDEPESEAGSSSQKTLAQARTLALSAASANGGGAGQAALRTLHKRSKAVKDYVLMRANGVCESCQVPAPFVRGDGTPYLEPHHTTRLSDGGADHPRHVAAICPTCHRHIHYGKDGRFKNAELMEFLLVVEESADC